MEVEAAGLPNNFRKRYSPKDIQRAEARKARGLVSESQRSLAGR